MTAFADWGDATNPLTTGTLAPLTFSPNPATPATTVTWTTFATTAATAGISTIWIQGHSPSPYLTDHYYPVAVNIGGVTRDFSSTGSGQVFAMATTGATATGTMSFSHPQLEQHRIRRPGHAHDRGWRRAMRACCPRASARCR